MKKEELKELIREVVKEVKEEIKEENNKPEYDKEIKELVKRLKPIDQEFINLFLKGKTQKCNNLNESVDNSLNSTAFYFCIAMDNMRKFYDDKEYQKEIIERFVLFKTTEFDKLKGLLDNSKPDQE